MDRFAANGSGRATRRRSSGLQKTDYLWQTTCLVRPLFARAVWGDKVF